MVTHEEMVEAFGDEGLLLMDVEQCREKGLSEEDVRILSEVGLPVRADQAFTTFIADEPRVGSLVVFRTPGGDLNVLTLGGTSGDSGMRYFLDIRSGVVGLLSMDETPQAEKVNSSLANFVEFLYRLRLRQQALNGESQEAGKEYTEKLWLSLKELDPVAFDDAEAWWSMVMDTLMSRNLISETRAFLEQRRAEVADTLSKLIEFEEAVPPRGTQREGFDRALSRLEHEGWQIVDAQRFASDTETSGLLSPCADHFTPDGALADDVPLAWRGGLPSNIQAAFAREGLVVSVPGQAGQEDDYDALLEMDADELAKHSDALMDSLIASVHGLNKPEEGVVTCLAADRSSDLCRISAAFDRLAAHGYLAEPDLWPTASGAWQQVHEAAAAAGQPPRAVFWTTQSHTTSFDTYGDLVDELVLQWAGDRELIAQALAGTGLEVEVPEHESTAFLLRPASKGRFEDS
ncbi:SUKH-4 family immunity protein [Nonomuraea sp. NPDC050451]|uniref:SUKH-4 family immunity protein n=1 Tax=Nonomuraea sp. NPDC050451 TaxID=3364364 RepID=UPI00378D9075